MSPKAGAAGTISFDGFASRRDRVIGARPGSS
jgi:hypothetical protein